MGKVILSGYIVVSDNDLAAVKAELPNHIKLTRAEPGCISFEVTQSDVDKNRFDVEELFANREAFDVHQSRVRSSRWGTITCDVRRHYEISEESI